MSGSKPNSHDQGSFDDGKCRKVVVAHGWGSPTENGMVKAREMYDQGSDYGAIALELVFSGLTTG